MMEADLWRLKWQGTRHISVDILLIPILNAHIHFRILPILAQDHSMFSFLLKLFFCCTFFPPLINLVILLNVLQNELYFDLYVYEALVYTVTTTEIYLSGK